jgi:hypothetical protein
MNDWDKHVFEAIKRSGDISRSRGGGSRAAVVVVGQECQMLVGNNPNRNRSKSASVVTARVNKAKIIADFLLNGKRY